MLLPASVERPVALVTGTTSGIGKATALLLAGRGFQVIGAGRRPDKSTDFETWSIDLTQQGAAAALTGDVMARYGRLDVLVSNAGAMLVNDVLDAQPDDWAAMIDLNFVATVALTRAALPHLITCAASERHCADIVFVGSLAAAVPTPGRSVYAATKAAVESFADVLRIETAGSGVRVSTIRPGLTATGLRELNSPATLAAMTDGAPNLQGVTPLDPNSVGEAIAWIVSQPADVTVSELTILPASQGQ